MLQRNRPTVPGERWFHGAVADADLVRANATHGIKRRKAERRRSFPIWTEEDLQKYELRPSPEVGRSARTGWQGRMKPGGLLRERAGREATGQG
jgi:hypothetical protein